MRRAPQQIEQPRPASQPPVPPLPSSHAVGGVFALYLWPTLHMPRCVLAAADWLLLIPIGLLLLPMVALIIVLWIAAWRKGRRHAKRHAPGRNRFIAAVLPLLVACLLACAATSPSEPAPAKSLSYPPKPPQSVPAPMRGTLAATPGEHP